MSTDESEGHHQTGPASANADIGPAQMMPRISGGHTLLDWPQSSTNLETPIYDVLGLVSAAYDREPVRAANTTE